VVFQGNAVKGGIEYYGVWRDRSEGSICPFVLNENGEADFGTGYGGEDRIYQFDIPDRTDQPGAADRLAKRPIRDANESGVGHPTGLVPRFRSS
jgi:hypothetical protein